jgi:hypothetical protein
MPRLLHNRFFWLGLAGILFVYSLYYLLLRDNHEFYQVPRKFRHVYKFLSVVWVYGIGSWALEKMRALWMYELWHLIHLTLIGFLLGVGAFDWWTGGLSFGWKHIAASIHEILISPVLYTGMVLVNLSIGRKEEG